MSTLAHNSTPSYGTPPAVRRLLMLVAALTAVGMVAIGTINLLDLAARHTMTKTTSYDDVRALVVDDADDIRLVGAPAGGSVRVVERITAGLRSPDRDAQRVEDGTLRLSSSCAVIFTGQCSVRYEISIPADIEVRARASGGDISVEDLVSATPVILHSSAGDVTATDVTAPALRLSSSAGDVEARGVSAGQIQADSSAGDVSLSVLAPPDLLDAESSAGDVALVVPDTVYRLDAGASAGDVDTQQVRIDPESPRAIRARSSAGDVSVQVRP